jgi:hypothetical protein
LVETLQYTLHATTPKDEVFFLGRHFGTKTRHTAEWVKDQTFPISLPKRLAPKAEFEFGWTGFDGLGLGGLGLVLAYTKLHHCRYFIDISDLTPSH